MVQHLYSADVELSSSFCHLCILWSPLMVLTILDSKAVINMSVWQSLFLCYALAGTKLDDESHWTQMTWRDIFYTQLFLSTQDHCQVLIYSWNIYIYIYSRFNMVVNEEELFPFLSYNTEGFYPRRCCNFLPLTLPCYKKL